MCGIFGYVGDRTDAGEIVLGALRKFESQSIDAWGIALATGGRPTVERGLGKIGRPRLRLPRSFAGVGLARHGAGTGLQLASGCPIVAAGGRFAMILDRCLGPNDAAASEPQQRSWMQSFADDGEQFARVIADRFDRAEAGDERLARTAIEVLAGLRGACSLVLLDVQENRVAAVKRGAPLVIGWGVSGTMIASDYGPLKPYTREVTFVRDHEAVLLEKEGCRLLDMATGLETAAEVTQLQVEGWPASLTSAPLA